MLPRTSLLLLFVATGCTAMPGPGRFDPESAAPASFAAGPVSGSHVVPESATRHEPPLWEGELTADQLVQLAVSRNPEIQALQARVAAREERVPQATALPDPMLATTFWPVSDNSVQTAAGRMTQGLSLSQRFPWHKKLRLRGEVADLETQIAASQLAEVHLKVTEAVRIAYFDLYFQQEGLRITQEQEGLLRSYLKLAEVLYANNKTSQQDVLRAQVELSKLKDRLVAWRRDQGLAQADLARLLAVAPDSRLGAAAPPKLGPVPQHTQELYEAALAARPELQARLREVLRNRKLQELARTEYVPDVTLGLAWTGITQADAVSRVADGRDVFGVTVGVNLPLWQRKLSAGVREAAHRTEESALLRNAVRDDVFRVVKRLVVQAHALEQQLELLEKEILPRTEQTLQVSVADYQAGKVVLLQLLDNWSELLRIRIQAARLRTALGQTLASLERAVGTRIAASPAGE